MSSYSDEFSTKVEIVEEDPRTPTMSTVNAADVYDWQELANTAQKELALLKTNLEREERKIKRLQTQNQELSVASARWAQDCQRLVQQSQIASNTNLVLSEKIKSAKVTIEALQTVIVLLALSPKSLKESAGLKMGGMEC